MGTAADRRFGVVCMPFIVTAPIGRKPAWRGPPGDCRVRQKPGRRKQARNEEDGTPWRPRRGFPWSLSAPREPVQEREVRRQGGVTTGERGRPYGKIDRERFG